MDLDVKQKVLLAIYLEYQKDLPNMHENVNHKALGLDYNTFNVAIDKLDNEGLISSATIMKSKDSGSIPMAVNLFNVKPTMYGIEYVEQKLNINNTLSNNEKVKQVSESALKWGWGEIKDIIAKTFAEVIKS